MSTPTCLADCSYVFIGCSRGRDASSAAEAFEKQAGNRLGRDSSGLLTPTSPFTMSPFATPMSEKGYIPDLALGPSATEMEQTIFDVGAPFSPFHYQLRKVSSPKTRADGRGGEYRTSRKRFTSSSERTFTDG